MSEILYRARLKAEREIKRRTRRPFANYFSPFEHREEACPLIHRCYHKVGTVWFGRVLREVAAEFGLSLAAGANYKNIKHYEETQDSDIFLDFGSHVNLPALSRYRGSHMIRDPRDMVISAYFYHKRTDEMWANLPRAEYRGKSYKEYLNGLDLCSGLMAEIENSSFWIEHMGAWKFDDERIYEIKYEEIIKDERAVFEEMFTHYGFSSRAVNRSCDLAQKYSIGAFRDKGGVGIGSHLRSGETQEWRQYFNGEHTAYFKERFAGVLAHLGYEKDDNW